MDKLSVFKDFDVSMATRLGQAIRGFALYEHPRHGDEFPIVAVKIQTGEKINTYCYDIEDARRVLGQ